MRLHRLVGARSDLLALLIATSARMRIAALINVHAWTTLSELVGQEMTPATLIARMQQLDREEALWSLARFASVLANTPGSVMGDKASCMDAGSPRAPQGVAPFARGNCRA
jgi:hypothetical protein